MRVLIVGCGLVGTELARRLRADGHHVTGTTTTPGKVAALSEVCDEVAVLTGADTAAMHAAAAGSDAIVVAAGPSAAQAMTVEERQRTYHGVLVATAQSVASVPGRPHVVMLSSLSVYGDAANHLDVIDESAPLTTSQDPSPARFQEAEVVYRAAAADRLTVFRCADVTGGDDPPVMAKLRMAHSVLNGTVPFHDEALFYRVHVLDVVAAIEHALTTPLVGTFNLTHPEIPPAMQPYFDALCVADGLPSLNYRNELRAPTRPVSVDALLATGFNLQHTVVEQLPEQDPAAPDRAGRELVTAALDRIVSTLGLVEEVGAHLPLTGAAGPVAGRQVGDLRVFTRPGGPRVVHSVLSADDLGLYTHQIYGFTEPGSAVPHLFLDTAISPATDGTFHVGLDLAPRVDLAANLAYLDAVYAPLDAARETALAPSEIAPVPSLGPVQWALRSPWLVAAITTPAGVRSLRPVVEAYVERWLSLVTEGVEPAVVAGLDRADLGVRDRRNRAALFSPRTNPVWGLLDRLLGAETGARLQAELRGSHEPLP